MTITQWLRVALYMYIYLNVCTVRFRFKRKRILEILSASPSYYSNHVYIVNKLQNCIIPLTRYLSFPAFSQQYTLSLLTHNSPLRQWENTISDTAEEWDSVTTDALLHLKYWFVSLCWISLNKMNSL